MSSSSQCSCEPTPPDGEITEFVNSDGETVRVGVIDNFLDWCGYADPDKQRVLFLLSTMIESRLIARRMSAERACALAGIDVETMRRILAADVEGMEPEALRRVATALGCDTAGV